MAAPTLNLDLSGIQIGQPRVPDPIYNALAAIQATINNLGNAHIAADAAIDILKTTYANRTSGVGNGTGAYIVSATSWTEVSTDFRVTINVPSSASIVIAQFSGSYFVTDATTYLSLGIGYDSTNPSNAVQTSGVATAESLRKPITVTAVFTGLAAGSHTFKVFGSRATTNATIIGKDGSTVTSALSVVVIP